MFPGGPGYRTWAVGFATLSFLTANLGLDAIIAYAVPVLMFCTAGNRTGASDTVREVV